MPKATLIVFTICFAVAFAFHIRCNADNVLLIFSDREAIKELETQNYTPLMDFNDAGQYVGGGLNSSSFRLQAVAPLVDPNLMSLRGLDVEDPRNDVVPWESDYVLNPKVLQGLTSANADALELELWSLERKELAKKNLPGSIAQKEKGEISEVHR